MIDSAIVYYVDDPLDLIARYLYKIYNLNGANSVIVVVTWSKYVYTCIMVLFIVYLYDSTSIPCLSV